MPTLFTESDFTANRYDDKTITIGTNYGLSITNFSDQGFQATVQRTGEIYVLPPYSLYTFPVQSNDSVIIQHLTANYNASKIGDRYFRYDQISNTVEPKLIPLSSFPVYQQQITGNVNVLGGSVNANITSGNVTANISNASINTQLLNAQLRTSQGIAITSKNGAYDTVNVSNLTANTWNYNVTGGPAPGGTIACNKITVLYASKNNYNYNIEAQLLFNYPNDTGYLVSAMIDQNQRYTSGLHYLQWINIPLSFSTDYTIHIQPLQNVTSDTLYIYFIGIMDSAQNGVQAAGAGIYSLANNAYTTIFTASNPVIIRGLYIGTGSSTVGQFRIDKNGSIGTPFLSLNTTTVSQYYPINPGYFLNTGETLQAYQATGSGLTANITIFYT